MGGGFGKMFASALTMGMWQPDQGKVKVDTSEFDTTDVDEQPQETKITEPDRNRETTMKTSEDRRNRMRSTRGRQEMRVDLSEETLGGSGISIRGSESPKQNSWNIKKKA